MISFWVKSIKENRVQHEHESDSRQLGDEWRTRARLSCSVGLRVYGK